MRSSSSFADRDDVSRSHLRQRFTGRGKFIEVFEDKLRTTPKVLMFFGLAGSGKTFLLNYLRWLYGHNWNETPTGHPHAYISFHPGNTPTTSPEALWSIRAQLRKHCPELTFPRFDLIWAKLWERTYKVSLEKNPTLIPEELSWLSELLGAIEQVPVIGNVGKAIKLVERLGRRVAKVLGRRSALRWFAEHLEAPYQLSWKAALNTLELRIIQGLLPKAIAADLAAALHDQSLAENRAIIFVDSYEHLQDELGIVRGKEALGFIQTMAEELVQLKARCLLVIGGRERIRWAEIRRRDGRWEPDQTSFWSKDITRNDAGAFISASMEQYLIDDLTHVESRDYLQHARGIKNSELIQQIYTLTGGYPLGLSAAADLILESKEEAPEELRILRSRVAGLEPLSEEWREELDSWILERLLEQLERQERKALKGLIRAAAVPRVFDEGILFHLVGDFDLHDQFTQLINFSFVEPLDVRSSIASRESYKLHAKVRALLRRFTQSEAEGQLWLRANNNAMDYFESRAASAIDAEQRFAYEVEALYHAVPVDRSQGLRKFEDTFERELAAHHISHCEVLLRTMRELSDLSSEQEANIYRLAGRLYMTSAQYDLAIQRYETALTHLGERVASQKTMSCEPARIAVIQNLAECFRLKGDYPRALEYWTEIETLGKQLNNPILLFFSAWGQTLTYKLLDAVPRALQLCDEANMLLNEISENMDQADLEAFGLHHLSTKQASIDRNRAELLRYGGNYAGAALSCDRFLAVYRNKPESLAPLYGNLIKSHLSRMEGDFDTAYQFAEEAKHGFEEVRDIRGELSAFRALGQVSFARKDDEAANEFFQRLVAGSSNIYPYGHLYGGLGLGELARVKRDFRLAASHYNRVCRVCQELGGKVETAYAYLGLAEIARQSADTTLCVTLAKRADEIGNECGSPWIQVYANLIAAAAASEASAEFLNNARLKCRQFKRRPADRNLENEEISRVSAILDVREAVPQLRLNFL